MSVSRDNILTIIRQKSGVNVDELATEMDLAPATVRRHLDILERDGLVDHTEVLNPPGRPQYALHLTETGHDSVPKDYSRLLNELVQDIKGISSDGLGGRTGDEVLKEAFSRIGVQRAENYGRGRKPVDAVRAAFEDGGYDPIIELDDDGLKVRVTNCPYRKASAEDSIVCTVDQTMMSNLLGDSVEHTVSMSPRNNECVYMLSSGKLQQIDS
jgi:predicted ArsR family transcriptional regulator